MKRVIVRGNLSTKKGISKAPYQKLDYITSTGQQFINTLTHFQPGLTYTVEAEIKFNADVTGFGHHRCAIGKSGTNILMDNNVIGTTSGGFDLVKVVRSAVNNAGEAFTSYNYVNGVQGNNTSSSWYDDRNLYLFAMTGWAGTNAPYMFCNMSIKSAKIYYGEELVRDMIPCIRKEDGVVCMYDTVNQQFYTNSGSGEFILPQ